MSKVEVGGTRLPDSFDRVMASTVGTTVQDWINVTENLDPQQYSYLTAKLMSDDDKDIEEGIRSFNDLI